MMHNCRQNLASEEMTYKKPELFFYEKRDSITNKISSKSNRCMINRRTIRFMASKINLDFPSFWLFIHWKFQILKEISSMIEKITAVQLIQTLHWFNEIDRAVNDCDRVNHVNNCWLKKKPIECHSIRLINRTICNFFSYNLY